MDDKKASAVVLLKASANTLFVQLFLFLFRECNFVECHTFRSLLSMFFFFHFFNIGQHCHVTTCRKSYDIVSRAFESDESHLQVASVVGVFGVQHLIVGMNYHNAVLLSDCFISSLMLRD